MKENIEALAEKERNEDAKLWLFAMIEVALENPKNLKLMQEIWKANDPVYKKWIEKNERNTSKQN